jgi:hypothetical protein
MQIHINLKEVYGCVVAYPVCAKAKIFASMCGTKTLTIEAMKNISLLGYEVVCEPTPNPLINAKIKFRPVQGSV